MNPNSIRNALNRWYDRHRRDLPWRRTRDPYAIWISEIMLQQTRVAAVIPYYERFLQEFPDVDALAAAPEDRVLTMWAGLGYYSRARNLRKSAAQIAQIGAGNTAGNAAQNRVDCAPFPRDFASIRALPGVGDYTAAAISSIAFGLPHAAVDGNVRRVITRLLADDFADVRARAENLLDRQDPGRWNQAMMELGAVVCTPRDPRCEACPIARYCEARRLGLQTSFPAKRSKPMPERLERILLVIENRGRILLTPGTRVRGFWDLPEKVEGVRAGEKLGEFRHTIMNRHYKFLVCKGLLRKDARVRLGKLARWVGHQKVNEIPLSTTAKKALRCLKV